MAKAVEFRPVPRPAIEETRRKLDAAPLEHAEAILNAYRTLQMLHDSNTLDMVRGLLGAGGTVLNESVSVLTSEKSMRAIRNLLVLINLAGEIDPQVLHSLTGTLAPLFKPSAPLPEPPSLFALARRLLSKDVRRVLGIGIAALEGLDRGMGQR